MKLYTECKTISSVPNIESSDINASLEVTITHYLHAKKEFHKV